MNNKSPIIWLQNLDDDKKKLANSILDSFKNCGVKFTKIISSSDGELELHTVNMTHYEEQEIIQSLMDDLQGY